MSVKSSAARPRASHTSWLRHVDETYDPVFLDTLEALGSGSNTSGTAGDDAAR